MGKTTPCKLNEPEVLMLIVARDAGGRMWERWKCGVPEQVVSE